MEIRKIDAKTLDTYALNHEYGHFMQTSSWAKVCERRGYTAHLLGVYEENEMVGSLMCLEKKIGPFASFYCPRGPLIDFDNHELFEKFLKEMKNYVKKHRALYFKFDPDIIIRKLDENARPIETFIDKMNLIDYFKSLGLRHRGFTTKFTESSSPRFTFRVDVDKDETELLSSFHNTTKKILKRDNPYKLVIRKGDINDVKDFYRTMKDTTKRKKMYLEPEEYFTDFYSCLNEDGLSDIFTVEADVKELKKIYELKKEELMASYEDLKKYNEKKQESLKKDLDAVKAKISKEMAEINKINDDRVVLSSIITAKFKDKVWTIHGGNSDRLMFLNGNYELYYEILKQSHREGYKYVDFYGTEGAVDKNSDVYGIYLFKLRFAGDFDEFVGEFDMVTKPLMNALVHKALVIRRKLLIKKSVRNS